jgi:crotonobetainyl-CoA:carnitine CoA-transferase CaiB-like acyl-CoA transferase
MIQAMCGLMSVTGEPDDKPGGCPEKVGVPIVDIMSGMYAAIAVLAALARRSETGGGDYIDIAMLDVGTACLANQAMNYLVSGKVPPRTGNAHPNIQPQDVFASRDGHMVLVVGNDGQFAKACEVLGHPEWTKDDRFTKNAGRVRNRALLTTLIGEVLRERDTAHWIARLEAAGVPCGPINTVPQVFADAQVRHRGMLVDIPHPLAGTVAQVVSPMRFSEAPLAFERAPPLLGEHTADILRELGIEEAQGAA